MPRTRPRERLHPPQTMALEDREIKPVRWTGAALELLDQTRLPLEEVFVEVSTYQEAAEAIRSMLVRGAPAIGVTAAYAVAMAARRIRASNYADFLSQLREAGAEVASARPTAVNLPWAVRRMLKAAEPEADPATVADRLLEEAKRIQAEDEQANRRMGNFGKDLMPHEGAVLTHCNAGALATAGFGTAIGVIRAAWEEGRQLRVYNTETRPLLQGSRLTAWEFQKLGIPSTLVADSAAGMLMNQGRISCVITGADRIASNGDTANKIGTYTLAVLARENGIPFYVAAPTSTIDLSLSGGGDIEIEHRAQEEVTHLQGVPTAPAGVAAINPAFDVTPHGYLSAIVTEAGVARPPYLESLRLAVGAPGTN